MTATLTHDEIDGWCEEGSPAVALHLRETLVPVEGRGAVVFPPTFAAEERARTPYAIDTLADGTRTVILDTVGSQANRMEPALALPAYAGLVPLHRLAYGGSNARRETSILEAGHRLGDAALRFSGLGARAREAFAAMIGPGSDPTGIAKLGPTSIVFGVWDSRGTQAKLPRIVQSVIRAYNISELRRSAQYFPTIRPEESGAFLPDEIEEGRKAARQSGSKNPMAQQGFVEVPAVGTHGGVIVHGDILRDCTLNLVAIRRLRGPEPVKLRRYILGLSLVATTVEQDLFLRAGCQLVPDADRPAEVSLVLRDGTRRPVGVGHNEAVAYAQRSAKDFGVEEGKTFDFDIEAAKKAVTAEETEKAGKRGGRRSGT